MQVSKRVQNKMNGKLTRREFLGATAAATAFSILPEGVLGAGGNRLNIAGIGVGNRGAKVLSACETENIVALCDVDHKYAAETFEKYPKARKYADYRRMFDQMEDDIDAVVIGTPDHTHAAMSMAAMERGMHVYCEKPLTHTVWEARQVMQKARETGVTTQMGNQGHSNGGTRLIKEWIAAGAIGDVREVHCWTPKHGSFYWPNEMKPKNGSAPGHLKWDLWCRPLPRQDYSPSYHPRLWRAWWDFGSGMLGDMGCHHMDAPYWALDLQNPTRIEPITTRVTSERAPERSTVRYEFPATEDRGPVTLYWYDGDLKPPRPPEMEAGRSLRRTGILFVGEDGCLQSGHIGEDPVLLPVSRMADFDQPPKSIPRVKVSHPQHWIRCCKQGKKADSDFSYSAPLAEIVLLGTVAIRAGRAIEWDADNMKVTNVPEANKYLRPDYRKGVTL